MTISEVSKKYDITPDTLRYYERIGVLPSVNRSSSGIRNYTEEDCNWVEFAKCMRSAGLQIEAIIEYVGLFQQGDDTSAARKQILIEQRMNLIQKMEEMQRALRRLNAKIERYDQTLKKTEIKLKKREA